MIVLSHYQAEPLLAAYHAGESTVKSSMDLNRSRATVQLSDDGVHFPTGDVLTWHRVQIMIDEPNKCFLLHSDGTIEEIITFSETTNWVRSLYPTPGAPTMLVSGVTMHRIEGTAPLEDTRNKIHAARPRGMVLDTATGLGYTAILAAQEADHVITVEVDPGCLAVAQFNPWSRELFDDPRIEQRLGDIYDVVQTFDDEQFSVIIHDPPMFSLAGHLYAGEFYGDLHRVLRSRGRLFHYVGDPESRTVGSIMRGVIRRLQDAGFAKVDIKHRAYGVVAYK
ncbi:MAG: methyltransferase [Anaerolineae bacterium]